MDQPIILTATIANGQSLSGVIPLGKGALSRIVMPAAWTAANLTLQTSYDGQNFSDLYDNYGTEYTINAAAGRSIIVPLADVIGVRFIKLRSGPSAGAVAQGADRVFTLVVQP